MIPVSEWLRRLLVASEVGAVLYTDDMVDGDGNFCYLDNRGSVRGLDEDEDTARSARIRSYQNHITAGDPHGS